MVLSHKLSAAFSVLLIVLYYLWYQQVGNNNPGTHPIVASFITAGVVNFLLTVYWFLKREYDRNFYRTGALKFHLAITITFGFSYLMGFITYMTDLYSGPITIFHISFVFMSIISFFFAMGILRTRKFRSSEWDPRSGR
jgi:hypothetical protein